MDNERQPLLTNSAKQVTVIPKREMQPPGEKTGSGRSKPKQSYTAGIVVALWITFLASVCFSIVLNSIYFYIIEIIQLNNGDENNASSILGWAVSVNSIGSFVASPLFGFWADRRSTREVLLISLVVMIGGNVMYSLASEVKSIWLLLAGRFIVGVASANYAVAQTYISYATTQKNRTLVMAINSAANVLGFIIGPALATALTAKVFQGEVGGMMIDERNSPGYLAAAMSLLGLFSLIWLKEIPSSKRKKREAIVKKQGSMVYTQDGKLVTAAAGGSGFYTGAGSLKDVSAIYQMRDKIPLLPVGVCLFAYFAYTCSFTTFETIGSNYTHMYYDWDASQNGIMFIVLGCVCIGALFLLQALVACKIPDRALLLILTVVSIAGFGTLMDWGNPKLNIVRFWIGICVCSGGYSTCVAVLVSVYSKVLEGLDQGMMMGWLSSASSVARIVGPVAAAYIFQNGGQHRIFFVCCVINGFLVLCLLSLVLFYRALTPREDPLAKRNTERKPLLEGDTINKA